MIKKILVLIFIFSSKVMPVTIDEAASMFSKEFGTNPKEIVNAFNNVKVHFKPYYILDSIKLNHFDCIKINETKQLENDIVQIMRKNNADVYRSNIGIDDLKYHIKYKILYNKYLKNSKNAFLHINPFLNEALILSVSKEFIIFTFLKHSSYYDDPSQSSLTKQTYIKFFLYQKSTGKVIDN